MFASSHGPHSAARRRGIVLVLVLGMLGLMALIGVTFAAFAGQSLKSGRAYSQGLQRPQPEALMDFALAQLINDTNNPLSAIRGHSLLRDMYGNDSVFRGSQPPNNTVADTGGLMSVVNSGSGISTLHFTSVKYRVAGSSATPFYNNLQYQTNIPIGGPYQGYDFTRWIVRFTGQNGTAQTSSVAQTFEILEDDYSNQYKDGFHHFTLSAALGNPTNDPLFSDTPLSSSDTTSFIYNDPNSGAVGTASSATKNFTALNREHSFDITKLPASAAISNPFVLDGRFMRAFNGPGLTRAVSASTNAYPYNQAANANMRIAGYDPDTIGMDEDYDACDLENWFLAIQSADGQVMIPSFHRPGILTANDWTSTSAAQRSKILRPRQADNSPLFPTDPSTVDSVTGKLTYDIDNDGDGITDSVWLDLGYPATRDPNGKLYKPLFAFMVLGLNGRLPLNTVGNLQARAVGDTTNNVGDTVTYAKSSGQAPYPGVYTTTTGNHNPLYSSQVFFDTPLYDHASHLGYSVNEINPKFALQNAPSNLYPNSAQSPYGVFTDYNNPVPYTQSDDAGVSVALTQMRNILAGTIPTDAATPYPFAGLPINGTPPTLKNYDTNIVFVAGDAHVLPNGVADNNDVAQGGVVYRFAPGVPGRWGEPEGIDKQLSAPQVDPNTTTTAFDPKYPILHYSNPVRAGRSFFSGTGGTNDAMDDDFDGFDPYLSNPATPYSLVKDDTGTLIPTTIPLNSTAGGFVPSMFNRYYPEDVDAFDGANQRAVASERIRSFVTPHDPAGVGRQMGFMKRPGADADYGKGADTRGRVGFFRYFRPAGLPQEVRYPYAAASGYSYATGSGLGQRYLMPVLLPAGRSDDSGTVTSIADRWTNSLHGFQAMSTPETQGTSPGQIAVMGARPFDWDPATVNTPAGYVSPPILYSPTIQPNVFTPTLANTTPVNSTVSTTTGPNVGRALGNSSMGYPIPYVPGIANIPPNGYNATTNAPNSPMVVNGYLAGSLNKDEADEMNLYAINDHDMPYGLSDLEWLYRKQDVDGANLNSRLAQLAPISFLNPADGLTRRRLFSTDSWDLINFSYANDNPIPYAGVLGFTSLFAKINTSDHNFNYNSRFMPNASPSLEIMNQIPSITPASNTFAAFANPISTEFLYNPTLPIHTGNGDSFSEYVPNSAHIPANGFPIALPLAIDPGNPNIATDNPYSDSAAYKMFTAAFQNATVNNYTQVIQPYGPYSAAQVQTPSLAHRDRKINLNFPLPISNDPAEPIRQKWCRETYQFLKAILPPAAVDTPEELAALSQYVVNIIDFRDTDCTATRFVNTDLVVTDALTKHSAPVLQPAPFNPVANVSPMGVRFALSTDSIGSHFPYDPSLYSPDDTTNPFLVQHGMEYSPIAINETFAVQFRHGKDGAGPGNIARGLFIELVNTLTEAEGNKESRNNASAIDLTGWDLIMTPDAFGWGRPDPISGEVPVVAFPPLTGGLGGTFVLDNVNKGQQSGNANLPAPGSGGTSDPTQVQQYRFTSATQPNNKVLAVYGDQEKYFIVGGYADGNQTDSAGFNAPGADASTTPPAVPPSGTGPKDVASGLTSYDNATGKVVSPGAGSPPTFDVVVPRRFIPYNTTTVAQGTNQGAYYWVYLRRPANPFDTDDLTATRPNREMVVVDAMRFPYMDAGNPRVGTNAPIQVTIDTPQSTPFSAQRLQPHRGGHLVPAATTTNSSVFKYIDPTTGTETTSTAVTTIAPPTPAYAYGYSEQTSPATPSTTGGNTGLYITTTGGTTTKQATTRPFQETIGAADASNKDTNWAHVPVHDRDFANVAELLLVPGCPPGLFTKQFVEEPYPGHAARATPPATGWDAAKLNSVSPPVLPAGAEIGQKDFGYATLPAVPTFPYLTDNFYYTAASVSPPISTAALDPKYTHLTTEIGGWTGAGWHKMLEFFEVPSSANGAIGNADLGENYDWYRADLKPGQLNLNLIIDEEVFAGLIDDPRLNENLVYNTSALPFVVSQIDANGYPVTDAIGNVTGAYPIFPADLASQSTNLIGGALVTDNYGRGYAYRDPNAANYVTGVGPPAQPQLLHGLKAAFSDFLKLRSGGSGYLFAHGGGDVSMGDFTPIVDTTLPTQPVAADRPYRSLSYPDINYTIMRPASLPPSPVNATPAYAGSAPPLTLNSANLFTYAAQTGTAPYVTHNPSVAPINGATPASYLQDPGIRNPFLDIQFNNTIKTFETSTVPAERRLAPPYDIQPIVVSTTPQPIPAAFPPTIPPTPARRLFQVPDRALTPSATAPSSNASLLTQQNGSFYTVNQPVITQNLWSTSFPTPPTLIPTTRAIFAADNLTPQAITAANNDLGAGPTGTTVTDDLRMHPVYRTEMIQKISNLTTVRTQQFATWITVGFFEVVATGTPELGVPDTLGGEIGTGAGNRVRYRAFFVIDRTKATGFNPYYPGNFRDCVTYRRRIE